MSCKLRAHNKSMTKFESDIETIREDLESRLTEASNMKLGQRTLKTETFISIRTLMLPK